MRMILLNCEPTAQSNTVFFIVCGAVWSRDDRGGGDWFGVV